MPQATFQCGKLSAIVDVGRHSLFLQAMSPKLGSGRVGVVRVRSPMNPCPSVECGRECVGPKPSSVGRSVGDTPMINPRQGSTRGGREETPTASTKRFPWGPYPPSADPALPLKTSLDLQRSNMLPPVTTDVKSLSRKTSVLNG